MTNVINQEVNVSAYYFAGREMKTFPKEIEYGGEAISFANGLRYLIQRGAEAVKLFDMSGADGLVYRLRQNDDSWTLVGTRLGAL
jgi:hypothetical protein